MKQWQAFPEKRKLPAKNRSMGSLWISGTTTLAACLCGMPSGRIVDSCTAVNRQRIFGADVISRIQASVEGTWTGTPREHPGGSVRLYPGAVKKDRNTTFPYQEDRNSRKYHHGPSADGIPL